jgi:hypothetical protein
MEAFAKALIALAVYSLLIALCYIVINNERARNALKKSGWLCITDAVSKQVEPRKIEQTRLIKACRDSKAAHDKLDKKFKGLPPSDVDGEVGDKVRAELKSAGEHSDECEEQLREGEQGAWAC